MRISIAICSRTNGSVYSNAEEQITRDRRIGRSVINRGCIYNWRGRSIVNVGPGVISVGRPVVEVACEIRTPVVMMPVAVIIMPVSVISMSVTSQA